MAAGLLLALLLATVTVLRLRFHGPPLARLVQGIINEVIRGRVHVESVEWPLASLHTALIDGWLPVTVHGVEVYDDGGSGGRGEVADADRELLIKADRATGYIDLHALLLGYPDFVIKDLAVPDGGYVLLKEVMEPSASGDGAYPIVSLISAFDVPPTDVFHAGLTAIGAPIFDLRSFSFEGVCVELSYPGFHLVAEGARGDEGFLYSDFSDPLRPRLYYSLSPTATRGLIHTGDPLLIEAGLHKRTRDDVAKGCMQLVPATADGDEAGSAAIFEIPVHDVEVRKLAQLPTGWPRTSVAHDVRWSIGARTGDGAVVDLDGGMLDYWTGSYGGDWDIQLSVRQAGPLLHRLSAGVLGGDDVALTAWVDGPVLWPRITVQANGMDILVPVTPLAGQATPEAARPRGEQSAAGPDTGPLRLHLERTTASFDLATEAGFLRDTVARGAGGEVAIAASFGIVPFHFDLEMDVREPMRLGPYLPKEVARITGTNLRGHLRIAGDGERLRLDPLDMWLGRARVSGALVKDEQERLHTRALRGNIGKTEVITRGTVNLLDGHFDLRLGVQSQDLAWWLRYLDAPRVASGLDGTVLVSGSVADPQACASLRFTGIPAIDQVATWLGFRGQVLSVDVNKSPAATNPCARERGPDPGTRPVLGGKLWASGRMRMGPRVRVLDMEAKADGIELGKVPELDGLVEGTVSASATARGPIDRLDARAEASANGLTIAGDAYELTTPPVQDSVQDGPAAGATPCRGKLCFRMRPDGTKQLSFALTRQDGGELGVHAAVDAGDALSGEITLQKLPIDRLDALKGDRESLVGGVVTAALTLGGALDAPTVAGNLGWIDGWYRRAFFGSADFRIEQLDAGRIAVEGDLLQGDLHIAALVQTQAPYRTRIRLGMRRVELDRFAPELFQELGARAWVTGEAEIDTILFAPPGSQPQAPAVTVRLSEAEIIVDNQDSRGRPAPIRLRNARETPIAIRFDGVRATLIEPVVLRDPAGAARLEMNGSGSADELDITAKGDIDMRLFMPYVREYFDAVSGKVSIDAVVRGPVLHPRVAVDLGILETISVRPVRQDADVSLLEGGRINVTNDQIVSTGTRVVVVDRYAGQQAALDIRGGIRLDEFVPAQWALQMEGELAGKMLLVVAPEVFSQASGTAKLSVSVLGPSDEPTIDVLLDLATRQQLSFTPRGLGREIRFTSGQIELSDDTVELRGITGWLGDEGRIADVSGTMLLRNWQPAHVDMTVSADNLPFSIPQTLDLTVNIDGLEVVGGVEDRLHISGDVEVVNGRYTRKFNLITDVLSPERSTSTGAPFYESVPLLANAKLGLRLDVRGFAVQNNLATIQMSGAIEVAGTPREPRFNGKIQVDQGEFKLPGARAKFTRTQGAVTFSETKKFPGQTPELNVQSEGDYRDSNGQYHLITLTIDGPLSSPKWDLYTSSGLNKGQTVTMLFSGRTPAELRKSLGDEAPGLAPGRFNPSTSTSENVADQLLKDIAGDFISLLVEDTLRNLTTLDVARIEIGTGSIGFYGEKELADNVRMSGNFEQTGSGRTVDVRGEVQVSDRAAVETLYLNKDYDDPAEEDISDFRLRAVWRQYFWP